MPSLTQSLPPAAAFALRVLLAAFFLFLAIKNLGGDEQMAADFQRWGYPGWFGTATALLQVAGAVALVVPAVWP